MIDNLDISNMSFSLWLRNAKGTFQTKKINLWSSYFTLAVGKTVTLISLLLFSAISGPFALSMHHFHFQGLISSKTRSPFGSS